MPRCYTFIPTNYSTKITSYNLLFTIYLNFFLSYSYKMTLMPIVYKWVFSLFHIPKRPNTHFDLPFQAFWALLNNCLYKLYVPLSSVLLLHHSWSPISFQVTQIINVLKCIEPRRHYPNLVTFPTTVLHQIQYVHLIRLNLLHAYWHHSLPLYPLNILISQ